jgi:hypothetical protein
MTPRTPKAPISVTPRALESPIIARTPITPMTPSMPPRIPSLGQVTCSVLIFVVTFNALSRQLYVTHHISTLHSYKIMMCSSIIFSYDFIVVVIGFPMGASLTATERINTTVNVCPQILQGILERSVSVYATSMGLSATGNYDL